ncbi:MAG: hypothetical protein ACYTHK_05325 [Planctomycetota bacterium]
MRAFAALLLVAGPLLAESEVVREEIYNYRIVGTLPAGWKRTSARLSFTYSIDGVPHAYVHFVRQRLRGDLKVKDELRRRAQHYRFPGAGKDATETYGRVQWAGRSAYSYEHVAKVNGLVCKRVVRALYERGIWYECIETHHGEPDAAARAGLACFRRGFRLLVEPVPADEKENPAARDYADGVYGYRLRKPEGFVRVAVDPGAAAGCRLAFERRGPTAKEHLSVRLFEYGVRRKYEPARWLELFAQSFGRHHAGAKKEAWKAPQPKGARRADGMKFSGRRDEREVVTTMALWQAKSGRVIGLRVTAYGGAGKVHAPSLQALVDSIELR